MPNVAKCAGLMGVVLINTPRLNHIHSQCVKIDTQRHQAGVHTDAKSKTLEPLPPCALLYSHWARASLVTPIDLRPL